MPNWCDTTYKCVGDKKELGELFNILEHMRTNKKPATPNCFGAMWLGELVGALGFDKHAYSCRGEVIDYYLHRDGVLDIYQNTAWREQNDVRECIERRFKSVKVYYLDIEQGCENFSTNDVDGVQFPERFYFDDIKGETETFTTFDELNSYLLKEYGCKANSVKDVYDFVDVYNSKAPKNDGLIFHEIEVITD